nr:hypothetical protein CKAN_02781000 [Ipomoea batatas]
MPEWSAQQTYKVDRSLADPILPIRVGFTQKYSLFGPEPAGNGPTYLACRPAAELTLVLLVWWCYQDDFFMPIKGPRDANPRKTIR